MKLIDKKEKIMKDEHVLLTKDELTKLVAEAIQNQFAEFIPRLAKEMAEDKYLTTKETMEMLDVSSVTLNKWRDKGLLNAYKMGKRVYYKKSELNSHIEKPKIYNN